jgi:hypothetical protein
MIESAKEEEQSQLEKPKNKKKLKSSEDEWFLCSNTFGTKTNHLSCHEVAQRLVQY